MRNYVGADILEKITQSYKRKPNTKHDQKYSRYSYTRNTLLKTCKSKIFFIQTLYAQNSSPALHQDASSYLFTLSERFNWNFYTMRFFCSELSHAAVNISIKTIHVQKIYCFFFTNNEKCLTLLAGDFFLTSACSDICDTPSADHTKALDFASTLKLLLFPVIHLLLSSLLLLRVCFLVLLTGCLHNVLPCTRLYQLIYSNRK